MYNCIVSSAPRNLVLALPSSEERFPLFRTGEDMAFRKAVRRTALIGGGVLTAAFSLSQLSQYRRKQVSA